jgi:hypothetical protein
MAARLPTRVVSRSAVPLKVAPPMTTSSAEEGAVIEWQRIDHEINCVDSNPAMYVGRKNVGSHTGRCCTGIHSQRQRATDARSTPTQRRLAG